MTEEELKQEAIKYAVDYPTSYGKGYKHKDLRIAYLAGAEPREKQIQIDAEQIRALQKQNGELTDKITELKKQLGNLYEIIKRPYQFTAPKKIQMVEKAEQFLKEVEK
jgi:hypothetical protein